MVASQRYAANGNFSGATFLPGAVGFNIADVPDRTTLNSLAAGVKGLVNVNMTGGSTSAFQTFINTFVGAPNIYGFLLAWGPNPASVPAGNIAAEADYIHAQVPGAKVMIVLANTSSSDLTPSYGSYTSANLHLDLVGIEPFPARSDLGYTGGFNTNGIGLAVNAALAMGYTKAQIVPVIQAFGGQAGWTLPTTTQENSILAAWDAQALTSDFEMVFEWGSAALPILTTGPPILTPTSGGSITDPQGHVWTLSAAKLVSEDGVAIPASSNTSRVTLVNGIMYFEDGAGTGWYNWNGTSFVGPVTAPF